MPRDGELDSVGRKTGATRSDPHIFAAVRFSYCKTSLGASPSSASLRDVNLTLCDRKKRRLRFDGIEPNVEKLALNDQVTPNGVCSPFELLF